MQRSDRDVFSEFDVTGTSGGDATTGGGGGGGGSGGDGGDDKKTIGDKRAKRIDSGSRKDIAAGGLQ